MTALPDPTFLDDVAAFFHTLQDSITSGLESIEKDHAAQSGSMAAQFEEDS